MVAHSMHSRAYLSLSHPKCTGASTGFNIDKIPDRAEAHVLLLLGHRAQGRACYCWKSSGGLGFFP
jgi:hypothetical protein